MSKNLHKLILIFVFFTVFVSVTQAKPDLIISKVEITKDKSNLYLAKIIVTVKNNCRESNADASYVLITFKENSELRAKAIYFVGNKVKALKGGESQTQTFEILDKKIGFGRYVYIEADPFKKVSEASEENNWHTLFPDAAGSPINQNQCAN